MPDFEVLWVCGGRVGEVVLEGLEDVGRGAMVRGEVVKLDDCEGEANVGGAFGESREEDFQSGRGVGVWGVGGSVEGGEVVRIWGEAWGRGVGKGAGCGSLDCVGLVGGEG